MVVTSSNLPGTNFPQAHGIRQSSGGKIYLGYTQELLAMVGIVNQWGNSLGIRIPQYIASKVGFTAGTMVSIEVVNDTIVISSAKKKYSLDELLEGVTPELIGGEYDWGEPVGKKAW
jgi:antitoxin MazE